MVQRFSIQNLSNGYGRNKIIDYFSISLEKGESVALVGKNGSGMIRRISEDSSKDFIHVKDHPGQDRILESA